MQNLSNAQTQVNDFMSYAEQFRLKSFKEEEVFLAEYLSGNCQNFSLNRKKEIEVLSVLTKLGFSTDKLGTFLYRNMIVKAMQYLEDGVDDYGNQVSEQELLKQLQNPYSQFYLEVARYDLDIGIKTFHSFVEGALEDVDYKNADSTLLHNIYGDFSKKTDYGEHALLIGKYVNSTLGLDKKEAKQYAKKSNIISLFV